MTVMTAMLDEDGNAFWTSEAGDRNAFIIWVNDEPWIVSGELADKGLADFPDGAFQSSQWASDGMFSLWVPEGLTVPLGDVSRRTFLIDARYDNQPFWVDGEAFLAPAGLVRIQGSGLVVVGEGYWDSFGSYDGDYVGDHIPWGPRTAPVSLTVQRRWNNGPWVTIVEGLDPETSWTDPLPPTSGDVCYRVISWSDLGTAATGSSYCQLFLDATVPCPDTASATDILQHAWVNAGQDMQNSALAVFNLGVPAEAVGLVDVSEHRFAGRPYPVEFRGMSKTERIVLSARVGPEQYRGERLSTLEDWLKIVESNTDHFYRDYLGRYWPCSLSTMSVVPLGAGLYDISFVASRVEGSRKV